MYEKPGEDQQTFPAERNNGLNSSESAEQWRGHRPIIEEAQRLETRGDLSKFLKHWFREGVRWQINLKDNRVGGMVLPDVLGPLLDRPMSPVNGDLRLRQVTALPDGRVEILLPNTVEYGDGVYQHVLVVGDRFGEPTLEASTRMIGLNKIDADPYAMPSNISVTLRPPTPVQMSLEGRMPDKRGDNSALSLGMTTVSVEVPTNGVDLSRPNAGLEACDAFARVLPEPTYRLSREDTPSLLYHNLLVALMAYLQERAENAVEKHEPLPWTGPGTLRLTMVLKHKADGWSPTYTLRLIPPNGAASDVDIPCVEASARELGNYQSAQEYLPQEVFANGPHNPTDITMNLIEQRRY